MNIERTERLQPINGVQTRETEIENNVSQGKKATPENALEGTQVKLSDAQALLMRPSEQDIDVDRVAAIKLAIQQGELKTDSAKIADELLKNTL